ncbi:restriction endonuclease subunit S [Microbulbifer halophilus]|uniref:Restriction endonuclease subunit S n=1 Tax=Microbulbifer halophilus TaxID=453963 RepID=A0ABW5EJU9_9GAMM|nr:restriction endonuclease subunit S [Microbulbifer halophilus]MCW8127382.1 restriction endonuclease subunit S [Microbulbifer halophilus]
MSEWKAVKISDVAEFFIGGTPSRTTPAFWADKPDGHPWISISDLQNKYISETSEHITDLGAKLSNVKEIPTNSVVMSFKLSIGRVAITSGMMYCNEAIAFFKPNGELDTRWLYHVLPRAVKAVVVDTAVKGATLNKKKMSEIELRLPTVDEQTTIADILDTLDTQIRQTEAIIAKLQQVKQGLLHDLLTRGIDANGQLRPPRDQAPELYKESPLGWVPREWETSKLLDLLADVEPAMRSGPFGSALLKSELVEEGIPLLGIDNVHVEVFRSDFRRFVTPEKFSELKRYSVRPDDIMITIMGTVGRCCLVPKEIGSALSSKHTWTITLDSKRYRPYLAMLQINYAPWVLRHFSGDEQGGTMSAIRSDTLRSTRFPVPPIDEQLLIEQRLKTISERIQHETLKVKKLKLKKSGLMDDLLSGRVRVTSLPDTAKAS